MTSRVASLNWSLKSPFLLYALHHHWRFTAADLPKCCQPCGFLPVYGYFARHRDEEQPGSLRWWDRRGLFISMFLTQPSSLGEAPANKPSLEVPVFMFWSITCATTFFWTLGTYLIQHRMVRRNSFWSQNESEKVFLHWWILLGLVLVMLQVKLWLVICSIWAANPLVHDIHRVYQYLM